ncbi:hypothetical protein FB451DRAFT_1263671, partial [Mycena latifolia]
LCVNPPWGRVARRLRRSKDRRSGGQVSRLLCIYALWGVRPALCCFARLADSASLRGRGALHEEADGTGGGSLQLGREARCEKGDDEPVFSAGVKAALGARGRGRTRRCATAHFLLPSLLRPNRRRTLRSKARGLITRLEEPGITPITEGH